MKRCRSSRPRVRHLSLLIVVAQVACTTSSNPTPHVSLKYYPDGALKSVQEITTDSIRDGMYVQFFSDTTIVEARKTYSMDMREGMSVEYYRNGFVKSRVPYHLDKEEGTARWYYDSGGLDAIVVYKQGVKQSPGVCYF